MKKILIYLSLFPLLINAQTTIEESIVHDGEQRDYTLYFPSSYDSNTENYALVFNFHGFTSNGEQQRLYSQMDLVSDTAQFVVCYPEGIGNAWNVGWAFGSMEDDVGFTSAMIDKFIAEHRIDPNRVYACGMSNGGFFSYKLACELSNKIAAVASVTGSIVPNQIPECTPGRAVPVLEIHGTDDPIVPYNGSFGVAAPIEDVIDFWVDNNNCSDVPTIFDYPNISTTDASTAQAKLYRECDNKADVDFIIIEGGGHTWPDAPIDVGVTNKDLNASQTIWEFFNKFSLENTISSDDKTSFEKEILVYPNPSSGKLWIKNIPEGTVMELFTANGSLVHKQIMHNTEEDIDLDKGLYILRFRSAERSTQFLTIIE